MSETEASDQSARRAVKTRFGKYRVIGRLGSGGMAQILLTVRADPTDGTPRMEVVKQVLPEIAEKDSRFHSMFLDEAKLATRLTHPKIVRTLETGEADGTPYLSMEFLDGQSLNIVNRATRAAQKRLPVAVSLRIVCDVLEGLQYAHELKNFDGSPLAIIHRDVTPSNVFVQYDGTTKLTDFGIAKSTMQSEKTRAGTLKGKIPYMAPEQLRDLPVTTASDVWSVGVVCWELLAGERLFQARNEIETIQNVLAKKIPRLSEIHTDVPAGIDDVLGAALARDPAVRIASAGELRARIEAEATRAEIDFAHADVGKVMHEVFGEMIVRNHQLVAEFTEKACGTEPFTEVLRLRLSGALERQAIDDVSAERDESSVPSRTLSRLAGEAKRIEEELASRARADSSGRVATIASPQPTAATRAASDFEPTPAWQWGVLAIAVLVGSALLYVLLFR